jgi:streptogramin lyase
MGRLAAPLLAVTLAATTLAACGGAGPSKPVASAAVGAPTACPARGVLDSGPRVRVGAGVGPIAVTARGAWAVRPRADTVELVTRAGLRAGPPIRVPGSPVSIVAGAGYLWLAARDANRVVRIDPGSGRTRTSTPIDVPVGVAVGRGSVWALSLDDGAVYRVNVADASIPLEGLAVPVRDPFAVVGGGSDLWLAGAGDRGVAPFDTRISRFAREGVRVPVDAIDGLAAGAGAVWMADAAGGQVLRMNPHDLALDPMRAPSGLKPTAIAVTRCALWMADGRSGIVAVVDPRTAKPLVAPSRVARSVGGLAADGDAVWLTDPVAGTVARLRMR